ncbi:RidA family protein [uncultured Roseibium sp.]|uniref:RidA family protein n=1 Tax=uncultured Roseibium sp. TaxID=1936171 RepID=UPI0025948232|nr:RidA family protein [uncultured Roseibium sp.]
MPLTRINLPELGLPVGPYSHAVRHGDTLYTSGFTAFGTDAQSASASAQAAAIFDQLERIATSQGSSMEKLVKVTVFITDPASIPSLRDALTERYAEQVPASSMVIVNGLFAPELALEVEAIFAL